MKKNIIWIIFIIIILLIIVFFIFKNTKTENNKDNNNLAENNFLDIQSPTDVNILKAENRVADIIKNKNEILNNSTTSSASKELSSYSTIIKDNSAGRLTNISITCKALDNTIIKANETFSFNDIVGKPTVEKGYQEANVIINNKTEKGIGGGNCQVSSTIYNAVLAVPELSVVERHEHGMTVSYVPEGKDAAVSYGSLDLKFKNNTGKDLILNVSTDNSSILAKLTEL